MLCQNISEGADGLVDDRRQGAQRRGKRLAIILLARKNALFKSLDMVSHDLAFLIRQHPIVLLDRSVELFTGVLELSDLWSQGRFHVVRSVRRSSSDILDTSYHPADAERGRPKIMTMLPAIVSALLAANADGIPAPMSR